MSCPISRRFFLKASFAVSSGLFASQRIHGAERSLAGWIKSPENPVLSLGSEGQFDHQNIFAPSIIKERGRYFLFYAGGPEGPAIGGKFVRYQLGLALSDDGRQFTKTGRPLLPLGKRDNFHATPALLRNPQGDLHKIDERWQMVYCGNRAGDIELATSLDGLHWNKDSRSPIYRKAYSPNLVGLDDEVRMYYIHKSKSSKNGKPLPWEIHLASGPDLLSLQPHRANPLLRISQPWEQTALFYPYVIHADGTWVIFYASYWAGQSDNVRRTAIGTATSEDGITWKKNPANPIFTPTPTSGYDSHYTSSQSIIRDGNGYTMFYASRIDAKHKYYAICKATKQGRLMTN